MNCKLGWFMLRRAHDGQDGCAGGRAADTPRWANTVMSLVLSMFQGLVVFFAYTVPH